MIIFNRTPRDAAYKASLCQFIESVYPLEIWELAEADRGWYGETWKLVTAKACYFVKIIYYKKHIARFTSSLPVFDSMCQEGIDFISRLTRTTGGELFCVFRDGALAIFDFIEGIHTEEYALERLFIKLAEIYKLKPESKDVQKETFDTRVLDEFTKTLTVLQTSPSKAHHEFASVFEAHQDQIEHWSQRLRLFSGKCKEDLSGFHITSGDVGGNVIVQEERLIIIDWDYILLAPMERDLWYYMHDDRQIDLINHVMQAKGIYYELNTDRLAFYCYSGSFYHLCEYMSCFLEVEQAQEAILQEVVLYLGNEHWMRGNLVKADQY